MGKNCNRTRGAHYNIVGNLKRTAYGGQIVFIIKPIILSLYSCNLNDSKVYQH